MQARQETRRGGLHCFRKLGLCPPVGLHAVLSPSRDWQHVRCCCEAGTWLQPYRPALLACACCLLGYDFTKHLHLTYTTNSSSTGQLMVSQSACPVVHTDEPELDPAE